MILLVQLHESDDRWCSCGVEVTRRGQDEIGEVELHSDEALVTHNSIGTLKLKWLAIGFTQCFEVEVN